jgi:phosphoglycolate phosphatase
MAKPLVIFDFDGVLVDTAASLKKMLYDEIRGLGYDFLRSPEDVVSLFDENIADALVGFGVTPDHLCAIWERVQDMGLVADTRVAAGVPEMLAALAPLCTMAIVSASSTAAIRETLTKLGIVSRFVSISGGDEEMIKVRRIRECAAAIGADAEKTLYIGDTAGDIREARDAGVMAVAATWGLHPAERLEAASPDCIVRTPAEIVDLVKALAQATASA